MPHCVTMRRARSVARWKSLEAPVVICFMNSSSAMRPPNSTAMVLQQAFTVLTVAILIRQLHGHAERATARNDGHLVHRIGLRQQLGDHRVAGLVIGGIAALLFGHDHRAALGAHHDLVLGAFEVVHVHQALVAARSEQRRFVHQIGQIGTGEAGAAAGQYRRVDVRRHRHLAHMHLEDLLAAANIGQRHHHLAVEAAGAQQRRIEHVGTVGGGDHDDADRRPRNRPSRPASGSGSARARRCRRRGRHRAGDRRRRSRR